MDINVAVCNDIRQSALSLMNQIKACHAKTNDSYHFFIFESGKAMIKRIEKGFYPDIIFMDIVLEEEMFGKTLLGTEVGRRIKMGNPDILIIYVSAYECDYKDIVRAEPFYFLSVPFTSIELKKILSKARSRIYYLKESFTFTYLKDRVSYIINLKSVMYFESRHRLIYIYYRNGSSDRFYMKLDDLEKEVDAIYPYFIRVHKSYYVNYNDIVESSKSHIMVAGLRIRVSAKYKEKYLDKMVQL